MHKRRQGRAHAYGRSPQGPERRRGVLRQLAALVLALPTASAAADGPPAASLPASAAATAPSAPDLADLILDLTQASDAKDRRTAAARILRMGSEEGTQKLVKILELRNNTPSKLAICEAVAEMRAPPEALAGPLLALLNTNDDAVRDAAAGALTSYTDPAVRAGLAAYRREREEQQKEEAIASLMRQVDKLTAAEADRVKLLQAWLKDSLPVVRVTALDLVFQAQRKGTAPAPEILQQIRAMLNDPDEEVLQKLLAVLRDHRTPEDSRAVRAMLESKCSDAVRESIYETLGYLGDPASIPACVGGLQDPADAVVTKAAFALGKLGGSKNGGGGADLGPAVSALRQRASSPIADPILRESIVDAMAQIASPDLLETLITYATDAEPVAAIRQHAIRGIGRIGASTPHPSQLAAVLDRLAKDSDPRVRETAAEALGSLGARSEHLQALRDRLNPETEPSTAVQTKAWEAYRAVFKRLPVADQPAIVASWVGTDPVTAARRIDLLIDREALVSAGDENPSTLASLREQLGDAYCAASRYAHATGPLAQALDVLPASQSSDRIRLVVKLVDAHLQTPAADKAIAAAAGFKQPEVREAVAARLLQYVQQTGEKDPEAAGAFVTALAKVVPDRFGEKWSGQFDKALKALQAPASKPSN